MILKTKFTFIAGMALLFVGVMIGMSVDQVVTAARGITIVVAPEIAAALKAAIVVAVIVALAVVSYRGMIQPRERGD